MENGEKERKKKEIGTEILYELNIFCFHQKPRERMSTVSQNINV